MALLAAPPPSLATEGRAAVQTADPSCPDDSGAVFVDCGNGTVTDNRTGLVWLQDAACLDPATFKTSLEMVWGLAHDPLDRLGCGLTDNSSPGEWRMPSRDEWEAMVDDFDGGAGDLDCNPTIGNDQGDACWSEACHTGGGCAFTGVAEDFTGMPANQYWAISSSTGVPANAYICILANGFVTTAPKDQTRRAWPVRGGQ